MLDFMDRAAIRKLKKKGWSARRIAKELGIHRDTVTKALLEPFTRQYSRPERPHAALPYREQITDWIKAGDVGVERMLDLVREQAEQPYTGSRSAFFAGVAKIRELFEADAKERFVRFEGLPGEYAQVDWGEVRELPFLRDEPRRKRYFLAVRLKFSRAVFVKWTDSMTQEVLLRGLIEAFEHFGGVPWVLVFDNMKTVTLGRDEHKRPIWHPVVKHFANDFDFTPEACDRASGNQKGSVENLVGWVKSSFVPRREFLDDADLAAQNNAWMDKVNGEVSQAHGEVPAEVLLREQPELTKLHCGAADYGLLRQVQSNRDGYVHVDGFQYLIPIGLAEKPLVARIRKELVEFHDADRLVACYPRRRRDDGKSNKREFLPEHLEPMLEGRPKARIMVYREHLRLQHPELEAYLAKLCRARRGIEQYGPHILRLYEMLEQYGIAELVAACNLAAGEGAYGAEYVLALIQEPPVLRTVLAELRLGSEVPAQEEIDRDLQVYEDFVIGGGEND